MTLHVSLAHLLKRQLDTPLGRRDALLVCLFLDQGLRCDEVHTLRVKSIDLEAGTIVVSGEEGNSTHHLTADTLLAAMTYLPDVQGQEDLFPGRVEKQTNQIKPLDQRALRECMRELGERLGIVQQLTPRDPRLSWATSAKRHKTAEITCSRQRAGAGLLARTTCRSSLALGIAGGKTRIPAKRGTNTPLFEHFPESPPCKSNKSGLERRVYVAMSYVCRNPIKHIRNFSSLDISWL